MRLATLVLAALVCAIPSSREPSPGGGVSTPTRTINVDMVDTAFEPPVLTVATGERVTFRFKNRGKAKHDAFIGTAKQQQAHEREMRNADRGHSGHGDSGHADQNAANAVTVKPGKTAKLTHAFNKPGTLEIGCHEPGHYKADMKITITAT